MDEKTNRINLRATRICALLGLIASLQGMPAVAGSADAETENWLRPGRTLDEQRFSPLTGITSNNIDRLGLAWSFDFPINRGIEATPLVIDGTLYVTGSWSVVYALDAATGKQLWSFDPQVDRSWGRFACCGVVNRGVAALGDTLFVGTVDGFLVAIDRRLGRERWRVDTISRHVGYTITGAPRVIDGRVIIGNGGAELGVRGFVAAYDAATGAMVWRFYTVPGDPAKGFESAAMKRAARTWSGHWWEYGGGGTVWDSMAYDAKLDLLYIGVGNGSPWNAAIRSPGGGDNLYLSSIVALHAKSGTYAWHFQTTPGESWDFTATQPIVLADLTIARRQRHVLLQAPKNGFFYVLDRATGKFISAAAYVPISWASGVDPISGRPIETTTGRYGLSGISQMEPTGAGGHNWHPMAFSPATGLMYFSSQRVPGIYQGDPDFQFHPGFWNTGVQLSAMVTAARTAPPPPAIDVPGYRAGTSRLVAWDPVHQAEVWHHEYPFPSRAGVLATAGNLVFEGDTAGEFAAYAADHGAKLWAFDAKTALVAAPISYSVGGIQYIAVAAGWGGAAALVGGPGAEKLSPAGQPRLLVFKLDAHGDLPPRSAAAPVESPPASGASPQAVEMGEIAYHQHCAVCHGVLAVSGGVTPDLRKLPQSTHLNWDLIVREGAKQSVGMPRFGDLMTKEETDAVHSYVISRANALALRP